MGLSVPVFAQPAPDRLLAARAETRADRAMARADEIHHTQEVRQMAQTQARHAAEVSQQIQSAAAGSRIDTYA